MLVAAAAPPARALGARDEAPPVARVHANVGARNLRALARHGGKNDLPTAHDVFFTAHDGGSGVNALRVRAVGPRGVHEVDVGGAKRSVKSFIGVLTRAF